jgi:hypothetical protein
LHIAFKVATWLKRYDNSFACIIAEGCGSAQLQGRQWSSHYNHGHRPAWGASGAQLEEASRSPVLTNPSTAGLATWPVLRPSSYCILARSWAGLAGSSLCSSVRGLGPARRHKHGRIALMRQPPVHPPQKAPNCRGTVAFMLRGSTVFPAFGSAGMQTSSASVTHHMGVWAARRPPQPSLIPPRIFHSSSNNNRRLWHGYGVFDRSGTEGGWFIIRWLAIWGRSIGF